MQSKGNNLAIFCGFGPHSGIELKVNQVELVEDSFLYAWMNLTGFETRQVRRSALFLI